MDGDTLAGCRSRAALFAPSRLQRIGRIWALAATFVVAFIYGAKLGSGWSMPSVIRSATTR